MSHESIIVTITCIGLMAVIFAWWLYAFRTDKLSIDAIKPIHHSEPLTSSPYMNPLMLAIIRCFVGFLSLSVMVYNVLCVYLPSDMLTLLCSYHVWCWILMLCYFLLLSFSTLCHCLSSKNNLPQCTIRVFIWIIYQIQLSLSFTLLVFMWLYLYFSNDKHHNNYLYHFADLTMISCNFLFIWSDFFLNDIPLQFHYGLTVLLMSTIYLIFVWILSTLTTYHIGIYPFLDPSIDFNAIWFVVWSATHFISWIIVYNIAYIKIKYQKKEPHTKWTKVNQTAASSTTSVTGSTTEIQIKPDGSHSRKMANAEYLSVPDLMLPKPTVTIDEEEEDDEDVLYGMVTNERSPLNINHGSLHALHDNRFERFIPSDIDTVSTVTFRSECTDTPTKINTLPEHLPPVHLPALRVPNLSLHERMKSVRILADVEDALSQRRGTNEFMHKKGQIEQELLNTEETYLKGLRVLLEEFIKPMFKHGMIDKKYENALTCNIPQLILFHEGFLSDLYLGPISKVFNEKSDFLKIYIQYICQYEHILDIFAKCKNNNPKLENFLNTKRAENKPLSNHLILPIQRIPRYMLMLSELKKHTPRSRYNDYKDIDIALNKVTEICKEINEKQREIENMSQCLKITETLKGLDFNIVEPQRKYINHFIFKRKSDGRKRLFFVFNDIVIIANMKWEAKRVIKLLKFEAKKPNEKIEQVLIQIIGDTTNNKNYDGLVPYLSTKEIPQKNAHPNVSNVDVFCEMIAKYRDRMYKRTVSRTKLYSGSNETVRLDINLELIELIRDEQNKTKLQEWEKSKKEKGNKQKVLNMLGSSTVSDPIRE